MSDLLQINQVLSSQSANPCKIIGFLGGGGQGEVYKVQWGSGEFALKWYYSQSATKEQKVSLHELINKGKPNDQFLWPEAIIEEPGVQGFGYIMPLRNADFKSLTDFFAGKIQPTFLVRIIAGIELVKAFRKLHDMGFCYRDISFGNAFFNPVNGDILVCDNDNVVANRSSKGGVLGTPDFMAPEIVCRKAYPSRETDLYSLAVLLFYIFHIGHPLEGKKLLSIRCWDGPAREKMFGHEPVFIFDPKDQSNAAVEITDDPTGETGGNAKIYWDIYPLSFKDSFIKAFTIGLHDPDQRVTEGEWLISLIALRDSLINCECGTPNFYDYSHMQKSGSYEKNCWSCGKIPRLPFRIRIGKSIIMLNANSKLYPHHMADGRDWDFSVPVAEVVRHPTDPNIWGLKNLTENKWVTTLADGTVKDVEPGRSVPLATNVKIEFGKVQGDIRY